MQMSSANTTTDQPISAAECPMNAPLGADLGDLLERLKSTTTPTAQQQTDDVHHNHHLPTGDETMEDLHHPNQQPDAKQQQPFSDFSTWCRAQTPQNISRGSTPLVTVSNQQQQVVAGSTQHGATIAWGENSSPAAARPGSTTVDGSSNVSNSMFSGGGLSASRARTSSRNSNSSGGLIGGSSGARHGGAHNTNVAVAVSTLNDDAAPGATTSSGSNNNALFQDLIDFSPPTAKKTKSVSPLENDDANDRSGHRSSVDRSDANSTSGGRPPAAMSLFDDLLQEEEAGSSQNRGGVATSQQPFAPLGSGDSRGGTPLLFGGSTTTPKNGDSYSALATAALPTTTSTESSTGFGSLSVAQRLMFPPPPASSSNPQQQQRLSNTSPSQQFGQQQRPASGPGVGYSSSSGDFSNNGNQQAGFATRPMTTAPVQTNSSRTAMAFAGGAGGTITPYTFTPPPSTNSVTMRPVSMSMLSNQKTSVGVTPPPLSGSTGDLNGGGDEDIASLLGRLTPSANNSAAPSGSTIWESPSPHQQQQHTQIPSTMMPPGPLPSGRSAGTWVSVGGTQSPSPTQLMGGDHPHSIMLQQQQQQPLVPMHTEDIRAAARDQSGCRQLQQAIESLPFDSNEIRRLLLAVEPFMPQLMADQYGNFLFQKIHDAAPIQVRLRMLQHVVPSLARIAATQHGTFAVQKLVESIRSEEEAQLIFSGVQQQLFAFVTDSHGGHVIQRVLQSEQSCERRQFIFDGLSDMMHDVCCDKFGCCVVQKCIDAANDAQVRQLAFAALPTMSTMVADQYGNYVVQKLQHALTGAVPPNVQKQLQLQQQQQQQQLHQHEEPSAGMSPSGFTVKESSSSPSAVAVAAAAAVANSNNNANMTPYVEKTRHQDLLDAIGMAFAPELRTLCTNRYASKSIEASVRSCDDGLVAQFMSTFCNDAQLLRRVVGDNFGNYIIQTMLVNGPVKALQGFLESVNHVLSIAANPNMHPHGGGASPNILRKVETKCEVARYRLKHNGRLPPNFSQSTPVPSVVTGGGGGGGASPSSSPSAVGGRGGHRYNKNAMSHHPHQHHHGGDGYFQQQPAHIAPPNFVSVGGNDGALSPGMGRATNRTPTQVASSPAASPSKIGGVVGHQYHHNHTHHNSNVAGTTPTRFTSYNKTPMHSVHSTPNSKPPHHQRANMAVTPDRVAPSSTGFAVVGATPPPTVPSPSPFVVKDSGADSGSFVSLVKKLENTPPPPPISGSSPTPATGTNPGAVPFTKRL